MYKRNFRRPKAQGARTGNRVSNEQRLKYIEKLVELASDDVKLWMTVATWISQNIRDKQERVKVFRRLIAKTVSKQPVSLAFLSTILENYKLSASKKPPKPGYYDREVLCRSLNVLQDAPEGAEAARTIIKISAKTTMEKEIICRALDILKDTPEGVKAAKNVLKAVKKESLDKEIICRALDILKDTSEGLGAAKSFVKQEAVSAEVLCRSLDILRDKPEGLRAARKLIQQQDVRSEVLCRCLMILDKEAELNALDIIINWEKTHFSLVWWSLQILRKYPEHRKLVEHVVDRIIDNFQNTKSPAYFYRVKELLKMPLVPVASWSRFSKGILGNWQNRNRIFVTNALMGYREEYEKAEECCREILKNWDTEIERKRTQTLHIRLALAHPALKKAAAEAAKKMLERETKKPGMLEKGLLEVAEGIVEKKTYPTWFGQQIEEPRSGADPGEKIEADSLDKPLRPKAKVQRKITAPKIREAQPGADPETEKTEADPLDKPLRSKAKVQKKTAAPKSRRKGT